MLAESLKFVIKLVYSIFVRLIGKLGDLLS